MAWCIFSCLESHTCSLTEMVQSAIPPTDLTLANFEMAQFNRANLKVSVRCSLSLVVAFYQLFPGEPAISWHFK